MADEGEEVEGRHRGRPHSSTAGLTSACSRETERPPAAHGLMGIREEQRRKRLDEAASGAGVAEVFTFPVILFYVV